MGGTIDNLIATNAQMGWAGTYRPNGESVQSQRCPNCGACPNCGRYLAPQPWYPLVIGQYVPYTPNSGYTPNNGLGISIDKA